MTVISKNTAGHIVSRILSDLSGLGKCDALLVLKQARDEIKSQPEIPAFHDRVISMIAREFAVKPSDILGKRRYKEFVEARHLAMYVFDMSNGYKLGEIGRILGGRTPATVHYGIQRMSLRIQVNGYLNAVVGRLMEKTRSNF